jgi:putative Holliday junction resolvase
MALDYGLKRTGIAVSDINTTFAFPLTTVPTSELFSFILAYLEKEDVGCFVIGLPLHADDTPAAIEPHISGFIKRLTKTFPHIPVERYDERYTSKMAFQAMLNGGVPQKKRRNKELLDKISATIILQNYLENKIKY